MRDYERSFHLRKAGVPDFVSTFDPRLRKIHPKSLLHRENGQGRGRQEEGVPRRECLVAHG